ncbi:MAG: hypothetical protein Q7S03_00945 [bacterium]|nr:hypothetical protein [bacterium]
MKIKPAPPSFRSQALKDKIRSRHAEARETFSQKHPHANNFFSERGLDLGQIRQHSSKMLTAGTLASALLLTAPQNPQLPKPNLNLDWVETLQNADNVLPNETQNFLTFQLKKVLPKTVSNINSEEERQISFLIEKLTGIKVRATLEGEHLNTTYGLIGAEQHLPRFPGDTVNQHSGFKKSGVTPGRGAWGYFAYNKKALTVGDIKREKYYVAVQTLYLPDWNIRFKYLRDWYKYRKVLVLNPQNGQAVVAVIADSGPAAWTGKQFGGSPEVMYELRLNKGMQKGPVLLLFVDDPNNKVELGPVDYSGKVDLEKTEKGVENTI